MISKDRGDNVVNLENGDWLADGSSEMCMIPGLVLDVPRYFRMTRGTDRQMFEFCIYALPPNQDTRLKRLDLMEKREYSRDQLLHNNFLLGRTIKILSNCGKNFPSAEINDFINYVFEFIFEIFKNDTASVRIEYEYPVDGRRFEFFRNGSLKGRVN